MKPTNNNINIKNKRASFDFAFIDTYTAGIVLTGTEINLFCWCGGEEETYTQKAAELIRSAGYTYAFMTNSEVIRPDTNRFQMDRSNIEASWPISLVKFQICGLMDYRFSGKRRRVHKLTGEIDDEKSN